jgi:hypothetical protein
MRELQNRDVLHRVKGRPALERRREGPAQSGSPRCLQKVTLWRWQLAPIRLDVSGIGHVRTRRD